MDSDNAESLITGTDNAVVDRPIRSIKDVQEIEKELFVKNAAIATLTESRLVTLKIITWRPLDE
jgi:hypothetical protein